MWFNFALVAAALLMQTSLTWRADRRPKIFGSKIKLKSLAPGTHKIQRRVVQYHNYFRTKVNPPATNMLAMTWSKEAARDAQRWADSCQFLSHDTPTGRDVKNYGACGQNIFVATQQVPWFFAVKTWWLENDNFTFGGINDLYIIGHYTQMVWAASHKVGCGLAYCQHASPRPFYNYVCNYCPIVQEDSSDQKARSVIMTTNQTLTPTEIPNTLASLAQPYKHPSNKGESTGGTMIWVALSIAALIIMGFVAFLLTRWTRRRRQGKGNSEDGFIPWTQARKGIELRRPTLMISHSLPDLSRSVSQEQLLPQDGRKVARQTTLPTEPQRHASFKRQLSHRLHLDSVAFSVCSLQRKDKLGNIKPELYRNELVRQESVESSQGSETESAGTLSFTLKYDPELEGLVVKVVQAQNLPIKDVTGSSDPYVKVFLLPDRIKKFCTKVHRRNLNPVFNESFFFSVKWDELGERTLQFSVYDFDRFSRNDLIGQVFLRRLTDHVQPGIELEYALDMLSIKQDAKDLGELMLSLCYLPKAGRLTVTIIKMKHLRALDITGSSDPYVKVSMLCQGRRIKKKKTTVKKATLNPLYNESLVFDVPNDNIQEITLLIKVLDYDRVGSNELLGVVVIGNQAFGQGRDHWLEMLHSSRRPVAQWYSLQESVPASLPISPTRNLPPPLSCLSSLSST